jgi:hypothetical protein
LSNAATLFLFVEAINLDQAASLFVLGFHFLTHLLWGELAEPKEGAGRISLRSNAHTALQSGYFRCIMGQGIFVQQFCQVDALYVGEQQRNIIYSFGFDAHGFFYAKSLLESWK